MVRVTCVCIVAASGLGFSFQVRAWTDMKILKPLNPKCFSFEITFSIYMPSTL